MAESHFIRWNSTSAGVNGFIMFVVLASWLLSGILLCAPADAFAKIYVWKDARGKTHLTNRPPPEKFAQRTVRNYEKTGKVGNASETKADVRLVVDTVESAFRNNDVDALMRVYTVPGSASDAATDQVAKEALQQSLQLFF